MKTCLQSVTLVAERVLQINLFVHNEILELNHFKSINVYYKIGYCVKFRCLKSHGFGFQHRSSGHQGVQELAETLTLIQWKENNGFFMLL